MNATTNEELIELVGIMELLAMCVVNSNYVVQADLTAPIVLTDVGTRIRSQLVARNKKTRPNEATLAVALRIGAGEDIFVGATETNVDGLRHVIGNEITRRRILFFDPYDRNLAEILHTVHPDKNRLDERETLAILRQCEIGTYQMARSVVGPFGCIEVPEFRSMGPRRAIMGYYCEDAQCSKLHDVAISTGNTSIVRAQEQLEKIVREVYPAVVSERVREFREFLGRKTYTDHLVSGAGVINFIGDALKDDERTQVIELALRARLKENPGSRSSFSATTSHVLSNPAAFVGEFGRSEQMQLVHMFTTVELIDAIGDAARSGAIEIPPGLLRSARVDRWNTLGLRTQVGARGVRFVSSQRRENSSVGHVLHRVYSGERTSDLAYALNRPEGEDLDSLISFAFQERNVSEIVEECIIHDRGVARAVGGILRINTNDLGRGEMRDLLQWRLGISEEREIGECQRVLDWIDLYLQGPADRPREDKRGALSNIFVALESELMLALRFSLWALTEDHYAARPRFSFIPEGLPDASFLAGESGSRPTLHDLGSALSRLAAHLEDLPDTKRDEASSPHESRFTGRPFAFKHVNIYHDLTPESQAAIQSRLRECGRIFVRDEVTKVRNSGPAHGNTEFPDDSSIRDVLTQVRGALVQMAEGGILPVVYEKTDAHEGPGGRYTATFSSWAQVVLVRLPVWPVVQGLPSVDDRLVFVPLATGSGWGLLRFRLRRTDRGGSKWADWPPRRTAPAHDDWTSEAAELEVADARGA